MPICMTYNHLLDKKNGIEVCAQNETESKLIFVVAGVLISFMYVLGMSALLPLYLGEEFPRNLLNDPTNLPAQVITFFLADDSHQNDDAPSIPVGFPLFPTCAPGHLVSGRQFRNYGNSSIIWIIWQMSLFQVTPGL